jgi:environmental stress-induced protein Ves
MPWKNGKGETQEIAIDTQTPFRWRLSLAHLREASAFSLFPDYDRKLVFLGNAPVKMVSGDTTLSISPLTVFSFEGEKPFQAETPTECDDLGLLALRQAVRGGLHVAHYQRSEEIQFPLQGSEHFVYTIEGVVEFLESTTGSKGVLRAGETLWISRHKPVNLLNLRTQAVSEGAKAIWGIVTPLEKANAQEGPSTL